MAPNSQSGGGVLKDSPSLAATDELFDVLDEQGNKTGQTKPRTAVHRDGDWHRASDIWIINPRRGILLQRRAANKDSWPGYWDISCGGHLTVGDDPVTGALRELEEELGLKAKPTDLHYLMTLRSSVRPTPDFINNSFNELFWLQTNLELKDFRLQTSEISDIKYVSSAELRTMLSEQPSPLVPHPEFYDAVLKLMEQFEYNQY